MRDDIAVITKDSNNYRGRKTIINWGKGLDGSAKKQLLSHKNIFSEPNKCFFPACETSLNTTTQEHAHNKRKRKPAKTCAHIRNQLVNHHGQGEH